MKRTHVRELSLAFFLTACGSSSPSQAIEHPGTSPAAPRAEAPPVADGTGPQPVTPGTPVSIDERVVMSEDAWRARLTEERFHILREERTEPAFSCPLWEEHRYGSFYCGGCGNPLFHSRDKFDSGTGWPSFQRPVEEGRVRFIEDTSHGMSRTEVRCARCDGHLGHVFDDGPTGPGATGQRYCINGTVLDFIEESRPPE